MASDKVEYKDLFSEDITKKLKDLESGLKGVLSVQKDIIKEGSKGGKTAENIERTNKALKESKTARQGLTAVQKQQAKLDELQTKEGKELLAIKTKITKVRRESKQAIEAENNAYKKLTNATNAAQANLKKLAAQYGVNSKQAKTAKVEFDKLEKELRDVNTVAKDGRRDVGRYGTALQGASNSLRNFGAALGITAGLTGMVRLVKGAVGIFKDFEAANSNLKAILGATSDEMEVLSEQAKELGATTAFTASQVTELQTEFAKLGFPSEDIEQMTESTLNAAAAMGSDLGAQAALTGSTLKAFGLGAEETARVNDVLAASTTKSALDFSKLNAAMSTIAPVANSFGFSLEGTTALLGNLSNAGFDASSAATATRNIMLSLADSSSELGKSLNEPVTDLPSLVKGLKQLKGEGVDLAKALQLTDKRSVAAFSTFLDGADDLSVLNEQLIEAGESGGEFAAQMAEMQLDNLEGDVTKLGSAWEGFILSLESGNGSFSKLLRTITQVATQILSLLSGTSKAESEMDAAEKRVNSLAKSFITVGKIIVSAGVAFLSYKAAVVGANIASKAYSAALKIKRIALILSKNATRGANLAMKALNTTMKANPIGLVISGITTLITMMGLFGESVDEAADAQDRLNEAFEKGLENGKKVAQQVKTNGETAIDAIEKEAQLRIANGEDAEKVEKEKTKAILNEYENQLNGIKTRISEEQKLSKDNLDELQKDLEKAEENKQVVFQKKEIERLKGLENANSEYIQDIIKLHQKEIDNYIGDEKERIESEKRISSGRIKGLTDAEQELADKIAEIQNDLLVKETEISTKRNKQRKKSIEDLAKQLRDSQTRLIGDELLRETTKIENRYDDLIKVIVDKIKKGQVIAAQGNALIASLEKERLNEIVRLNIETNKKLREEAQKRFDDERKLLEKENEKRNDLEQKELDDLTALQEFRFNKKADDLERDLEAQLENNDELTKLQEDVLVKQAETETRFRKDALKVKKDRELELLKQQAEEEKQQQIKILEDQIKLLEKNGEDASKVKEQLRELEAKDIKEFNESERLLLEEQYNADIEALNRDLEATKDEIRNRELAKDKEANKERLNDFLRTSQKILQLTNQELDRKFALRNKENEDEISDREKSISRQEQLAEKGLENQLEFEERKRKEAQLKAQEELKRQQRIKESIALAEAYLSAFEARLNDENTPPDQAAFKALQDVLVAKAISGTLAGSLAGFSEGGYTGDNFGTSEVAGVVHGQEFVIDAATTKQMGLRGNDMSDFKNRLYSGNLFNHEFMATDMSRKQAKNHVDNTKVISAINDLNTTLKNKPVQMVEVDKLGNLIETVYKNGQKTVIKYKGNKRI